MLTTGVPVTAFFGVFIHLLECLAAGAALVAKAAVTITDIVTAAGVSNTAKQDHHHSQQQELLHCGMLTDTMVMRQGGSAIGAN